MAGKNDPSIYDDRSNIGSSDELDEYGVWVKSEPQDLSSSMPEMEELPDIDDSFAKDLDLPDFSDIEASLGDSSEEEPESGGLPNVEDVEFEEIPENSDLPEGSAPTSIDKDGFTEVSMNDFLDDTENESIDFGNLDSLDSPEPRAATADSGNKGGPDLSTQLLMKIAEELSSIRTELSTLKSELAMVRGDGSKPESPEPHGNGGGFFDEEDDEKIALTGDELDNILNTANFTEEAGSDASEGISDDFGDIEMDIGNQDLAGDSPVSENLSDNPDIISETGEDAAAEAPVSVSVNEEINFDEGLDELDSAVQVENTVKPLPLDDISMETDIAGSEDFDISLDLTSDQLPDFEDTPAEDGLDQFRDGVTPMTKITEDTSYLDEDPLASVPEEENLDLSNAVIDEPDLNLPIMDNPIVEPQVANISIDLDMEEPVVETAGASDSDDFTFETEDMLEIPITEDSLIDDSFPVGEETSAKVEDSGDFPGISDDFVVESDEAVPETEEPIPEESFAPPVSGEDDEGASEETDSIPSNLKQELKTVLSYMDQLLESLPEDKIEEFAKSEYFDTYKKLFEELGLV